MIRQVDMIEQRTLAWEECASQLERLCMPKLGLSLLNRRIKSGVFLHLNDEADLC